MKYLMSVLFGMMMIATSAQAQHRATRGGGSTVGGGNPADAYCVGQHGTVSSAKDAEGNEYSLCSFGRGEMDAWSYFRFMNGADSIAVAKFYEHPAAMYGHGNPASVYCVQLGGSVQILSEADGEFGMCKFEDNSTIEEWTLFRGPSDNTNEALVRAFGARAPVLH